MKNRIILVLLLALLSLLSGILIAKMSFIGKVGITFFYNEYSIFKSWWKSALLLFILQFLLFLTYFHFKQVSVYKRKILPLVVFVLGIVGFYFTYVDFTETSRRLMKTSFHLGFYLFWIGWMMTSLYYLFLTKKEKEILEFEEIYKHESQE